MSTAIDTYVVYKFIKALGTPFEETEAHQLGLIDSKGKRLQKARTRDEKAAMSPFDRLVFNLKRLLARVGVDSKLSTYTAALFLLREDHETACDLPDAALYQQLKKYMSLNEESQQILGQIEEEAPTNATGAAVVGTGDNQVTWVRKKKKNTKTDLFHRVSKEKFNEAISKL